METLHSLPSLLVLPTDHPLVECLEALYLYLVDVSGNIEDSEVEKGIDIFKENSMGAKQSLYLRMTPKEHVLVHHVPKYMRRTGLSLGPTSYFDLRDSMNFRHLLQIRRE